MDATITITTSSHPEFDLFASTVVKGRQFATRGNRCEVNSWVETLIRHGVKHGITFEIKDETL